ncbi:MAG: hypothetical protein QW158_03000 [Nitrososphaerales archaeon]
MPRQSAFSSYPCKADRKDRSSQVNSDASSEASGKGFIIDERRDASKQGWQTEDALQALAKASRHD